MGSVIVVESPLSAWLEQRYGENLLIEAGRIPSHHIFGSFALATMPSKRTTRAASGVYSWQQQTFNPCALLCID